MGRWVFLLIVMGAIGSAGYWTYERLTANDRATGGGGRGGQDRPIYVVTEPVTQAAFSLRLDAVATAKARESITVTAKTTDTISRIEMTDGQLVAEGAIIAEMTSRQQSAELAEARADLAQADKALERARSLSASGNVSNALLDQRQAERDTAQARVRAQESQVADRLIRAPFAGVLGLRQVSPGTLVRPGDVITTLDDVSIIKLDMAIPETAIAALRSGVPVTAKASGYPNETFSGVVTGIDSRIDSMARTIQVRAEIANPDSKLKPGMLLAVTLDADQRTGLSVPEEAIVPLGLERFVYVPGAKSEVERRPVKTGRRNPGQVEILEGLKLGDRVVTEGIIKLRPGAKITLNPPRPGQGRPDRPQP